MAKKIIQDIIVNKDSKGNRTSVCVVSQIKDTTGRKIEENKPIWVSQKKKGQDVFSTSFSAEKETVSPISSRSRKTIWFVAGMLCLVVIFLLSTLFSTAEIKVYPKETLVTLSDSFQVSTNKNSTLPSDIIQVEKTVSKKIVPDSEEQASIKATGKAFIYNEFSTTKQRLIVNTRLQTSDGLIYRIKQSVDVPGYTMEDGKKIPGRIEVEIIADDAGDKFNMKVADLKGDFLIPGLKDAPAKYQGFYGRLSSDIKGGYIGLVKKVSDEKIKLYQKELREQVSTELIKDFAYSIPKGYLYFEDVRYIEFDDNVSGEIALNNEISEKGVLKVFVFDEKKIAAEIANNKIENFDGKDVYPVFLTDIKAEIKGKTEKPWSEDNVTLNLQGQVKIVSSVDDVKLKNFVKGMKKSNVGVLISSEFSDQIQKVSINLRPQWNINMPKKAEDIKVKVVLE